MNADDLFVVDNLPKPLDQKEIVSLFQEMYSGSTEAKEKIALHNIKLVLKSVSKYKTQESDQKELVAIGTTGLAKAIATYDITKKVFFSTYAHRCIENEILMYFRKKKRSAHTDSLNKIMSTDKNGRELTLQDTLKDENDFVENLENEEVISFIKNFILTLNDRDKKIIMLYFGFYDGKKYSTSEVGKLFNLSHSGVNKIIKKILKQLTIELKDKGLIDSDIKVVKQLSKK